MAFNSFLLPDLMVVALLSVIRAYKNKSSLEYIILGGFAFATLYCVNACILTKGGYLSTTVMLLGLAYNLFLIKGERSFRISSTDNNFINGAKTIVQILCVWTITLFTFPALILNSFGGLSPVTYGYKEIGIFLFMIFSLLGISSAYTMVNVGKGTPLPLDQTQKLVTQGPYKYVRNPMAIAGIGQGIAISVIFGSLHIFIYALLGAVLWHYVVRPLEEKDMVQRFGESYDEYRSMVRCWVPTF